MLRPLTSSGRKSIAPTAAGLIAVSLATLIAYSLRLNLAATVLLQLLVVVMAALRIGFWQATVISVFANLCLVYFIVPPVFSFVISDPQNWVALGVFEFTALVVSRLSTAAQQEAANAANRQREIERLYQFSCELLLLDRTSSPNPSIVKLIEKLFGASAVALYDSAADRLELAGNCDSLLQECARTGKCDASLETNGGRVFLQTLSAEREQIGNLLLRGSLVTEVIFNAISSLTVATLERWRSFEKESRAEGDRQTEQLRAAVLDALAHDFKTPLTTIRTASSAMLTMKRLDMTGEKLATIIDSESRKLDQLTTRLLQTSRLDSADVRLHLELTDVQDIVRDTLSSLADQLRGLSVRTNLPVPSVELALDRDLMVMALSQIVDNAVKYSDPGTTISVSVELRSHEARIAVHNLGPIIPQEQLGRIFERFYRSPDVESRTRGTGLGLSVTKKIVEAHGGRVGARSGTQGNTFFLSLSRGRVPAEPTSLDARTSQAHYA